MKALFAVLSLAVILLFSGCAQQPRACTMEAKLCPDGSSVGRNPDRNCEFDACLNSGTVQIILEKNHFSVGEKVKFSIRNDLNEPIFLPGCNNFEIERFESETWESIVTKQCFWEGIAFEIKSGETKNFDFNATQTGMFHVSITASTGCQSGKPLSQANCAGSFTAKSKDFLATEPAKENFKACSADTDCILVDTDCCGCSQGGKRTAINKAFEQLWANNLACERSDIACIQVISNDSSCNPNNKAICTAGKCDIGYSL